VQQAHNLRKNRPFGEPGVLFRPVQELAASSQSLIGRRSLVVKLRRLGWLGLLIAGVSCKHAPKAGPTSDSKSPDTATSAGTLVAPSASIAPHTDTTATVDAGAPPDAGTVAKTEAAGSEAQRYRWLGADNLKFPAPVDSLQTRFPTPPGYQRVAVAPGSFAEWLRGLPLAAPGTPVVNNSGDTVFKADDDYVAPWCD